MMNETKKEFDLPLISVAELSPADSVMNGILALLSAEPTAKKYVVDPNVAGDYNIWKGKN